MVVHYHRDNRSLKRRHKGGDAAEFSTSKWKLYATHGRVHDVDSPRRDVNRIWLLLRCEQASLLAKGQNNCRTASTNQNSGSSSRLVQRRNRTTRRDLGLRFVETQNGAVLVEFQRKIGDSWSWIENRPHCKNVQYISRLCVGYILVLALL
jgi:hypothetical protein